MTAPGGSATRTGKQEMSPTIRIAETILLVGLTWLPGGAHVPFVPSGVAVVTGGYATAWNRVGGSRSYDYDWIVKHARLVIDTRNATANVKTGRKKIVKA